MFPWAAFIKTWHSWSFQILTTNLVTNGRKQWGSQKNKGLEFHLTRVADSGESGALSISCRKACGWDQTGRPRAKPAAHLCQKQRRQERLPAAPWLLGRLSPGDCAALPAAPGSLPGGYAGPFRTAGTSATFYCGSGLTQGNLCRPVRRKSQYRSPQLS